MFVCIYIYTLLRCENVPIWNEGNANKFLESRRCWKIFNVANVEETSEEERRWRLLRLSIPTSNCKKYNTTLFCPIFSLPSCSSRLPTRFDDILGGLTDPRTTSTCSSLTGLSRRRSGVYHVKNGLHISLTSFSVGFVDLLPSCYDIGCLQPRAC